MRKMTYLAVFEPAENGAYSVYFPNVLGCVSYGKNFQEAQTMAQEALELNLTDDYARKLEVFLDTLAEYDSKCNREPLKATKVFRGSLE